MGLHGDNKSFEAFFGMVGLEPTAPTDPPYIRAPMGNNTVIIGITCTSPFRVVALSGSTEAYLFHEGSMREGAGAHATALGDASGVGVLQVASLTVKSSAGIMAATIWGDILTMQAGAGVARITYPGGTDLWLDRPRNLLVDCVVLNICSRSDYMRAYAGGAGEYRFELSFASVDATAHARGGILGLAPVEDFGELIGPGV